MSQLLEQVLNQVLYAQASEQLQAEPYGRSVERQNYRNGTRTHPLTTRVGTLTLRISRLRNGSFLLKCLLAINAANKRFC